MLEPGQSFDSPGGSFTWRVVGPICRLYDREQLPWPSCSLQWRGKQPSWKRIGPRYVADMGTKRSASYQVELVAHNVQKVFIAYPGGKLCLDVFVNKVDGSLPNEYPSPLLQQLLYDRVPMKRHELQSLEEFKNGVAYTDYANKLDANHQRWWFRNDHYHANKDYKKVS